jgi:hypothetical protein
MVSCAASVFKECIHGDDVSFHVRMHRRIIKLKNNKQYFTAV